MGFSLGDRRKSGTFSDGEDFAEAKPEKRNNKSGTGTKSEIRMMKKKSKEEAKMRSTSNCDELRFVQCTLETKDLWDKFHDLETEMIITKTGR